MRGCLAWRGCFCCCCGGCGTCIVPSSSDASSSVVPIKSYPRHTSARLSECSRILPFWASSLQAIWFVCRRDKVSSEILKIWCRQPSRKEPATLRCCARLRALLTAFISVTI